MRRNLGQSRLHTQRQESTVRVDNRYTASSARPVQRYRAGTMPQHLREGDRLNSTTSDAASPGDSTTARRLTATARLSAAAIARDANAPGTDTGMVFDFSKPARASAAPAPAITTWEEDAFGEAPDALDDSDSDSGGTPRVSRFSEMVQPEEDNDSEDDDAFRRRLLLQARLRQRQDSDEDDRSEESDADEADEEDHSRDRLGMRTTQATAEQIAQELGIAHDTEDHDQYFEEPLRQRPVFVRKTERQIVSEEAASWQEEEEAAAAGEYAAATERRRAETLSLIASAVAREDAARQQALQGTSSLAASFAETVVDDTDAPGDEEEAYAAWRLRELARMKRDLDQQQQRERDQAEKLRRSTLTDEQILAENRRDPELADRFPTKPQRMAFGQRYIHSGAFFQDSEAAKRADFSKQTEDDVRRRDLLPEYLQVRNPGRSGRTKYTHLAAQDTRRASGPEHSDRRR
ncbi:hypothetical protein H696_00280 [Fonticula alba]|uniref:Micro-fibrillar-associated protein 1 C-terminal domain-containing protein n=1 Tax=Fonticula alba TaxID=691883 RepID=A0A058ZFH3_FONAL|nr:hypothetical protein H696_00280 [Fonticula alba]KCV72701.1 hypothetical protein H696_00280 [Fonticula alba]|eukprot:XP_009492402.1 hypothetical protein H696_00280 [Fonticula alba]